MKGKKILIMLGAVAVVLLMVSSATAVPQTNSKPVMEKVEKIEKINDLFSNNKELREKSNINKIKDMLNNLMKTGDDDPRPTGIFGGIAGLIFGIIFWPVALIVGIPAGIVCGIITIICYVGMLLFSVINPVMSASLAVAAAAWGTLTTVILTGSIGLPLWGFLAGLQTPI